VGKIGQNPKIGQIRHHVKSFSSDTGTLRTDGQTDGQTKRRTDRFAISISRVSMLTRDKNKQMRESSMNILHKHMLVEWPVMTTNQKADLTK